MGSTSDPVFGKNGGRKTTTRVATWNARSGLKEGQRENILLELGRKHIDLCALQEIRLPGNGTVEHTVSRKAAEIVVSHCE